MRGLPVLVCLVALCACGQREMTQEEFTREWAVAMREFHATTLQLDQEPVLPQGSLNERLRELGRQLGGIADEMDAHAQRVRRMRPPRGDAALVELRDATVELFAVIRDEIEMMADLTERLISGSPIPDDPERDPLRSPVERMAAAIEAAGVSSQQFEELRDLLP